MADVKKLVEALRVPIANQANPYTRNGIPNVDLVENAKFINSFMPISGDIQSGMQAIDDVKNKKYASALLNSVGLLPFVPSLGGTIKNITEPYIKSGLKFDVSEYPNKNELYLSRIEVPKEQRGQGIGTQAMQDLISYANENQKRITLTPSTDFGATSINRLKDFYKNLGFVENKGSNKDFSTRETMYKEPEN
jgi:GNAT superfamily N-acetyltransferase